MHLPQAKEITKEFAQSSGATLQRFNDFNILTLSTTAHNAIKSFFISLTRPDASRLVNRGNFEPTMT